MEKELLKRVGKTLGKVALSPLTTVAVVLLLSAAASYAGTSGTEFSDIYDTLKGWTNGGLGKTIAAGAFLTGIAMGVVKQSIISVVTGIGTALAVNYTPTVIENVVTAII